MNNSDAIKTLENEIYYIEHLIYPSDMKTTMWVGNRIDALKFAIESIKKLDKIEDSISCCNNCECYHGVKEYPEMKCYEDIKEIING